MALFKDMAQSGSSVFLNEVALDYSFIPKTIPYRDNQKQQIALCIKPLLQNRNGRNIIIHGPAGVGKTVGCKHILQELEEECENIYPIYINCWQKNTTYKVIIEMCEQLGYKFTQNKKTEELFAICKNIINKQMAVFVFDEIDKAEDQDFLYSILEEIYKKSVILITNYKDWMIELDTRIKSRLTPEVLEFKRYNAEEIKGILKDRTKYAFQSSCVDDEALDVIAMRTYDEGDVRIGLYLLREAGNIADEENAKKVTKEHAEKGVAKVASFSVKKKDELDSESQKILALVKKNPGSRIGDVFKTYQAEGGELVYKSFYRRVQKLDENKFISTEKIVGGTEGTTTLLKLPSEKKLTDFE